jgi:hypothetical protein
LCSLIATTSKLRSTLVGHFIESSSDHGDAGFIAIALAHRIMLIGSIQVQTQSPSLVDPNATDSDGEKFLAKMLCDHSSNMLQIGVGAKIVNST